jgi:hypothetical protein
MRYFFVSAVFLLSVSFAEAAPLTQISDLITQSAPSATTTHRIRFTATTAIPASGTITITSSEGAFNVPVGFDFQDVDIAVATSSNYVDRSVAATPDATNDGVSVVAGSTGSFTITLNSTDGIGAGDRVEIELGTNATYGAAGDSLISNPATITAYRILIRTANSGDTTLDTGTTMIALVAPVGLHLFAETLPPGRSNGLPSGTIAAGNEAIEISLNTDELATCRYATTTGIAYADMTGTFSSATSFFHNVVIYDHQNDTTYSYYVRCADFYGIANTDDYQITFTIDEEATAGVGGSDGLGGAGSILGGSQFLFQSSVVLSGLGPPNGTVYVLKDGRQSVTAQTNAAGTFTTTVGGLERGTYTFALYAEDRDRRKSASHSATLTVGQGTSNTIANILLPPTLATESDTIPLGEAVRVFGYAIPGRIVELTATPQGGGLGGTFRESATSSSGAEGVSPGYWEVEIPAVRLSRGTYDARARVFVGSIQSRLSAPYFIGIGEAPVRTDGARSDLNQDGKVNLIDFSILLSNWNTDDEISDINDDGIVNLFDVSIMLYDWTG